MSPSTPRKYCCFHFWTWQYCTNMPRRFLCKPLYDGKGQVLEFPGSPAVLWSKGL